MQKTTSPLFPPPMLTRNAVMTYWFRYSPRIIMSQIQPPALGHPQSFVWSGTACMEDTRKHPFPNAWNMGQPTFPRFQESPLGYWMCWLFSLMFCPEFLVWTWSLSLSDSFAKTGTHLQIIIVHAQIHSTLPKKYQTPSVWDSLGSTFWFVSLSLLEDWPFRNIKKYTVQEIQF